jgi:hypothetical protein
MPGASEPVRGLEARVSFIADAAAESTLLHAARERSKEKRDLRLERPLGGWAWVIGVTSSRALASRLLASSSHVGHLEDGASDIRHDPADCHDPTTDRVVLGRREWAVERPGPGDLQVDGSARTQTCFAPRATLVPRAGRSSARPDGTAGIRRCADRFEGELPRVDRSASLIVQTGVR